MENLAEKIERPPTEPGPTAKGSLWRLQAIFFQPKETFQEIAKKPTWLIAAILCVIIGTAGMILMMETIGFENVMVQNAQMTGREMTEEQIQMMSSPGMKAFNYAMAPIGTTVVLLATSGLLLAFFWLAGSGVAFSRVFSVVVHSFFAYTLVYSLVSIVIVMLAADPSELDIQNLVASHLGVLVTRQESPVLFAVLSSIDLFSFYCIFLLSLGMSIVGRKSFGTSAALVLVPWVLWVLVKMGLAAIFS